MWRQMGGDSPAQPLLQLCICPVATVDQYHYNKYLDFLHKQKKKVIFTWGVCYLEEKNINRTLSNSAMRVNQSSILCLDCAFMEVSG